MAKSKLSSNMGRNQVSRRLETRKEGWEASRAEAAGWQAVENRRGQRLSRRLAFMEQNRTGAGKIVPRT